MKILIDSNVVMLELLPAGSEQIEWFTRKGEERPPSPACKWDTAENVGNSCHGLKGTQTGCCRDRNKGKSSRAHYIAPWWGRHWMIACPQSDYKQEHIWKWLSGHLSAWWISHQYSIAETAHHQGGKNPLHFQSSSQNSWTSNPSREEAVWLFIPCLPPPHTHTAHLSRNIQRSGSQGSHSKCQLLSQDYQPFENHWLAGSFPCQLLPHHELEGRDSNSYIFPSYMEDWESNSYIFFALGSWMSIRHCQQDASHHGLQCWRWS
jgi:hypothetical protein